jgi:hypothetical protein
MDETFDLPVHYRNQELLLPSRLLVTGYIYYFLVWVNETEVRFERDDEGAFRAILNSEQAEKATQINIELLQAIADSLEAIGKE